MKQVLYVVWFVISIPIICGVLIFGLAAHAVVGASEGVIDRLSDIEAALARWAR